LIRDVSAKETVQEYVDGVFCGDVVACQAVRQATAKYQAELARIGDVDFPYEFNEEKAQRACMFFPILLCHSIGEWAGQPFQLSPWQAFIVWNLFGWEKRDGTRRFRRCFVSVARKNGKTTLCAGLAILLAAADNESGAQVFIGATKLEQAKLIHDEAERMLRKSPHIHKHTTILKNNIAFNATNSFIRPLGSDKPFDGLNPHGFFCDELHAFKPHHRKFFETMVTGSGSRSQPLQMIITTAADEKAMLYHEEADYARGVISGDIVDNTVFGMIFELDKDDDLFDESLWIKANPNLDVSVKLDYLKQQANEARNKPQAKNRWVRYHANRCVSSVEEAISAEIWDGLAGELSDWRTADGVAIGVDIGGRDDLAAYSLCAKFEIGRDKDDRPIYRYEASSVCFIAADSRRDLSAEPFATWIAERKLIKCDYVVSTLKEYLIEDAQSLGVEFVAYDPYQATQLAEELEQEGLKPVKMPQAHAHFTETMLAHQSELAEARFRPNQDDQLLRWCALNMAIDVNAAGKMMPSKKHSKEKIDAMVAYLMARRAVNHALPRMTGSLVM
jgi:phage terminase large subunit-like protein